MQNHLQNFHPQIHPSVLSTVTGYTVFLVTKPPAPGIGHAGTVQPRNSSVSEVYSIMKKPMPVIGLKMSEAVRNTPSAKMIPTVTCPWVNRATDTGPVREATPVFKDAQLCLSLTKKGSVVSHPPPRTVRYPRLPPPPRMRRAAETPAGAVEAEIPAGAVEAEVTTEANLSHNPCLKTEDALK